MYILKNAARNITRSKGRNILIGIIIIVISAACAITLAIRESANKIVKSYVEKNPVKAEISMNRNSLMSALRDGDKSQEEMINAFNDIKSITEEEVNTYGDSKYVDSYYYTLSLGINGDGLTEATDSLVKETTTTQTETTIRTQKFGNGNFPGMPPGGFGGDSGSRTTTSKKTTTKKTEKIFNEKADAGAFSLIGYNSYEDMKDFINGNYTITSGEVSSDFASNTCVISEELATLNKLEVGSTITIVDPKDTSKTYKLEVTGIYKENTDSSNDMSNMFTSSANNIITNVNVVKTVLAGNSKLEATITPTFIVKDSSSVDKFSEEVKEKGLSEYYTITSNVDEIESATESVDNVKIFATTFLIITLVIGGVVLVVINMINIRERRYEIGVLRTVGMKKSKLSLQFMSELLIVAMASLVIGAGIGACLSVPIANELLANEISNADDKYDDIGKNFGKDFNPGNMPGNMNPGGNSKEFKNMNFGVAKVNEVDSINAVVDFKVLGELLGIGVLLTLLSSLASMVAIARFSPLQILKERG
jgi:putative ABC transport system permease protein